MTLLTETFWGKEMKSVDLDQVTHFIAEDKYVTGYYRKMVGRQTAIATITLTETLDQLLAAHGDEFIRLHRNTIVRLSLITSFGWSTDYQLWLAYCTNIKYPIRVSRRISQRLRKTHKELFHGQMVKVPGMQVKT